MSLESLVRDMDRGQSIEQLARAFGIAPHQAEQVLDAVMPEITRSIERNTLSRGGTAELLRTLGSVARAPLPAEPARLAGADMQAAGIDVLDTLWGSKERSRAVAARASAATGLSEALIKQMLPVIATMAMSALAKAASGGLGSILGQLPGLGQASPAPAPSRTPPLSAPADVGRAPQSRGAGSAAAGSPLPLPSGPPSSMGGGVPYEDIAEVVLQRGTGRQAAGSLREILGSLLGFSTKGGVLGWIIRAVVLRYGMTILRAILSRVLLRR